MQIGTFAWILGSIASSTSLIMTNKHVMQNYHFNWPVTLSTYHFFCTYSLLEIMCRMHLFERATSVSTAARLRSAFLNVASIVFMNFNLKMNSVGFYQLSKLCSIPTTVTVNWLLYNKKTPPRTIAALLILLCGIAMFTVNEVSFNVPGCIVAILAVIFTVATQMNINIVSNQFNVFGPPMQHIVALPMALFGVVASLVMETFGANPIYRHHFETPELLEVLSTGVLALFSNVCAFALLGKTSAVTYQVVGHAKTILIFTFGLLFLDSNENETKEQTIKKIVGLCIGMFGTILYTVFEMQDKEKAKKQAEMRKDEEAENDQDSALDLENDEKFKKVNDEELPSDDVDNKE